ncbi:ethanolamine utilization protein EutH [Brachyspira hyodysenteriae]|uniref:ethanolamine utilization protein EutH n=1 Tax=Brachyspira hyodysenteriae TaxID=159 RepID=UPI0022CD6276|nr:ethanolamine utilization protein EutH [Brachyspira hyodysenteriae]MCZ9870309.1 ethanolamine utilization protein EutH [Brachyspira hyodysenteriae]MCZ9891064.1 ethanolamine utilization protein EutH [Brachyspira hyodysenteriae]MCZ9953128.1 ethanolamine utilization protein EutH [Brachyspira hyodysenteriae]MCZ9972869.1 ethanolamine utilization protein EutH [Brachyspira hyodysenteriae]MCZ9984615.1 ethanolamine utilization protein EutH [Brachyspira hyodysenteriae]
MSINEIILYLMIIFMVLGAIDKIIGNKFDLGEQFEAGFNAMGALALSMIGIICLAPVIAALLKPIIIPIYTALGADPSMFATTILANDMGGAPLALEFAQDINAGKFSAFIVGAMMGPTIVFSIPVAIGIINKEDHKYLALGIASGMITIPIGAFVGGLAAGYGIIFLIKNLIPIIIVSIFLALGLIFIRDILIKIFDLFSKFLVILITIGLVFAVIEALIGIQIIKFTIDNKTVRMSPISDAVTTVASIAFVLAGAFPLVFVLTKVASKPLEAVGKKLGMNDIGAAGLVATLANNIPMFNIMKDMNNQAKIINCAFAVSAAFTFGDHLGFTAGYAGGEYRNMIFPMIVAKLVGGITAIIVAYFVSKMVLKNDN